MSWNRLRGLLYPNRFTSQKQQIYSITDENLVVGGQEGIYPAKLCVDKNTVLKAAKAFAERGAMEKSVIWEKDGVVEPV